MALRGVLALLFGVVVFLWPEAAWLLVVASFAAFALLDGAFALALALTGRVRPRWPLLIEGLVGIAAGVLTIVWPGLTQLVLLSFIAVWAIAIGVFELVAAFQLPKGIEGGWLMVLSGLLSVALGIALIVIPEAGLLALAWLIGAYGLAFGLLMLGLAFWLRSLGRQAPAFRGVSVP
jgi:uncharacterized membrane protein HdeD (DUF308 family)